MSGTPAEKHNPPPPQELSPDSPAGQRRKKPPTSATDDSITPEAALGPDADTDEQNAWPENTAQDVSNQVRPE
ncbi:hypothetical protein AB4Y87_25475 [Paenarthrobacter sp. RAF54_2]|uniref:hypothetical protein n=1 Tax=Paenarthrobacter sp. RAF54_2 TaxID=3233061 RepID=UPI003F97C80C